MPLAQSTVSANESTDSHIMSGRTYIGNCLRCWLPRGVGEVRHDRQSCQIHLRVAVSIKHLVPAVTQFAENTECITKAVAFSLECLQQGYGKSQDSKVGTDRFYQTPALHS